MNFTQRLTKGWNAFLNKDPTIESDYSYYSVSGNQSNPAISHFAAGNDQSIIDATHHRMALDCASINIVHCKLDDNERFKEKIKGPLNECFSLSPNLDQTARQFWLDFYLSLFDWGVAVICPIEMNDENMNPNEKKNYGSTLPIANMRVGRVKQWKPDKVQVDVYCERDGKHHDLWYDKRAAVIVTNPFYNVMNRPNSVVSRLKNKLRLSDIIDEQSASNKFNMIIQMPYTIKTEGKRKSAEKRIRDLEAQLANNKYGIGYIDATEHIVQLNRSLENHILESIEFYKKLYYSQIGMTDEIMNGTADDTTMNNYYSRTIEPIPDTTCQEIKRKWLGLTALSQGQSIEFFRDPFKLIPVSQLPEIVDKFTRNEVMTTNEVRQIIGMKPSEDPRADELRNKNLSEAKGEQHIDVEGNDITEGYAEATNNPQE